MSERTLSPAQQKLLERLRHAKPAKPAVAAVRREPDGTPAPLSFTQQRLWFLEQLLPRHDVYTQPLGFLLHGKLDVAVLERCLAEIVQRHEPLRTTFPAVDGRPVQRIVVVRGPLLQVDDISHEERSNRQARAVAWIRDEAQRAFDLVEGPLFSARLLRLAEREHLLVLNGHHIVSDTWSFGLLIRELGALYPAFARHRPSPLPPLPMRYADFTRAQHEQVRGPAFARHLAYWKSKLGKVPPLLDVQGDRARPPQKSYTGGLVRRRLDAELSTALTRLSQREGVTPFMTLLSAFKVLLLRYTGQTDILIGSTHAGRSRPEVEPLFGFFANTVVLRTDLGSDPTFRELLGRVRTTVSEAADHQEIPFELLVNEYQAARDMSYNPLFQVGFVLQNAPISALSHLDEDLVLTIFHPQAPEPHRLPESGLELDPIEIYNGSSKFDLWLSMAGNESGLAAALEYDGDLFDRDTCERLMDHFEVLLGGIVADPGRKLSQLPILAPGERERLVVQWNATHADYPGKEKLLHELIEARAAEDPSAIALRFEDRELTYAELDARANHLAHELVELGVGPDVFVGLCVERSLAMIIGMLAILKAGGGYVPIDPTYPADRQAFMLRDAAVRVVLVQAHLSSQVPDVGAPVRIIGDEPAGARADAPPRKTTREHLAYVMYTSGSTGNPKGVLIRHRNIVNTILWMQAQYPLTAADRVVQKTPFTFDVSLLEIFQTLSVGGCLVMARPGGHKDATYLAQLCQRERITTLHFVASMLQVFLEDPDAPNCRSLRRVFASGEALSYALMEQFYERMPSSIELHNMYGPTEISIEATFWACQKDASRPVVPIGRPIGNTQIYIVDEHLEPVPTGRPGELCIGGAGVALGYLNRPELTAEKFPRDPFAAEEGRHLYRTGDLARYRHDGMIEFLGRLDDQVKVRGFRIELGEIEAALRQQPMVKDAVVMARADAGRQSLAAYVVPDRDANDARTGRLEHVQNWSVAFDDTYRAPRASRPEQDFSGWNSSYTGEPLPDEAMQEWVDTTVTRIRALRPSRVLELGCGTGLFLLRLAPECAAYHATDISAVAIEALEREVRARGLQGVTLSQAEANAFPSEPEAYDVIILNSVVQYFPSLDYLRDVLSKAARALRPGGAIFVGDVRSLPLLETFHRSVQIAKAPASRSSEEIQRRIRHAMATENELVIAPAFFTGLEALVCERILSKRGRHRNELTQFRYDVILRRGEAEGAPELEANDEVHDELRAVEDIHRCLASNRPARLSCTHLLDARLAAFFREAHESDAVPVDPEDLFALGEEMGYEVDLLGRDDAPGYFDVRFREPGVAAGFFGPRPSADAELGTHPLRQRLAAVLVPGWKKGLQRILPDFMIPPTFVLLDAIPIGSHGKVDRSALPEPAPTLADAEVVYVAPRSPIEETLAGIWAETLGLESVGTANNFFALGGDSIRSIQAVARARRAGLNLTVEHLFRNQTIAELAATLQHEPAASALDRPTWTRASFDVDTTNIAVEDIYPASPGQAYLLAQRETNPEPGLYALFGAIPIPGLDTAAFTRAWQTLIDRHPALRTSFAKTRTGDGRYVQIVHTSAPAPIEELDWRDVPPAEVEPRLHAYIAHARAEGYRLEDCPQMRIAFIRTAEAHHWAVIGFNYLQRDGWSTMLLLEELQTLYAAYSAGSAPSSQEKPGVSPRAYLERVERQDLGASEAFWRAKLQGLRRTTNLVESLGGHAITLADGEPAFAKQHTYLDAATTEKLVAVSREERITLNTLVHGAWALLLAEYTKSQDLVYGALVSGRAPEIPNIEGMVGMLTNILPVRPPSPSRYPTLRAWLRALQNDFLELRRHEHSSLSDVKRWSELPREGHPFESYIVMENVPMAQSVASMLDPASPFTLTQLGFPLRVEVWTGLSPEILFLLHYDRRLFRDGVITSVLRDIERAMAFMTSAMNLPPCLERGERSKTA
ncbi:amino acid adenylation domain-containing protein [Pendulispora brunnea]|uniref:Amino acid adenylation domain-containing protein n=1 Tax=Pendulispora brunnea TaxID=2905690 RepID=A0ABZ2KRH4_9BACT